MNIKQLKICQRYFRKENISRTRRS